MTTAQTSHGAGWSPATERRLRVIAPVTVGVLRLALWQFLVDVVGVSDYLLPSPAAIAEQFAQFGPVIWQAALVTGTNALIGLVVGTILAILLAALAARWHAVDGMSAPIVAALAVVPIVALAPVNSMFGADSQFGRQAIAALASFVPVFVNASGACGRPARCTATSCAATPPPDRSRSAP